MFWLALNLENCLTEYQKNGYNNENFPWLTAENVEIGLAPSLAIRMNFVGELGWELHHPIEYQNHIFDNLIAAGQDLGLKPFGIRGHG